MLIFQHMMRTSIILPNTLHQRLVWTAQSLNTTMSDLVRDLLDKALATQEQGRIERMYQALFKLKGICKEPFTDTSSQIDEILYGEHGAWRGQAE